jgi:hypothetical protein
MYDPPAGWRYGFPKPFKPEPGSSIEETLLRDGYPQHEIDNGGAKHIRFWDVDIPACPKCGSFKLRCEHGHTWIIPLGEE